MNNNSHIFGLVRGCLRVESKRKIISINRTYSLDFRVDFFGGDSKE